MATKEDGVFRKAYRDDAIIAIGRIEKYKKNIQEGHRNLDSAKVNCVFASNETPLTE